MKNKSVPIFFVLVLLLGALSACQWLPGRHGALTVDGARQVTRLGVDSVPVYWSRDGATLYVASHQGAYWELWAVEPQGREPHPVLGHPPFDIFSPSFSPDEQTIAFYSRRSGNFDIWTISRTGENLKRLTTESAEDRWPAWRPDGQKIAFISTRDGEVGVWTMNPDGSDQERMFHGGFGDWSPAWSPDGRFLAFPSRRFSKIKDVVTIGLLSSTPDDTFEPGQSHLWRYDTSTREKPVQLTVGDANSWRPVWSPDGRRIALTSDQSGNRDIWLMQPDGTGLRQVTTHPAHDRNAVWSPDGTRLAFGSNRTGHYEVWAIDVPKP
ncbi:MAG: PD40 domain-containing protein [Nitrospirae bacterium]|nr:PD40 domain-containing protein [Nitrospirota bacterium]